MMPAFVMRDDEDSSVDDLLYDDNWLGYHCLIQSYKDALVEYENFENELRLVGHQLDAYAHENGIHGLKRLRELAPNIRGMDYKVLEPMVNSLRDRGDDDLVQAALEAFRTAPLQYSPPSKIKDRASVKAAALQTLAAGSSGSEAETAGRMAVETAVKHEVTPKKDPWDLDLVPNLKVRRVVHPEDVLIQKLDGALKHFRRMEQSFYDLRDNGRKRLEARIQVLEGLLQDPHRRQDRQTPTVSRRRH
ncbi:hypothetical protein K8R04_04260 [Candidatus Uhrbacteria bacterium]|nr:hypothetical protein [Candidatus Uhrbacteria bacterium]